MGWKSLVWVGCLVPVLAGCGALRHDAEPRSQRARDARRDARDAWQALRDRHPDRTFSDAFRDGFLDGYAEHTARAPMDAPARDYDLGFRYATDVANVNDSVSVRSPVSQGKPATNTGPVALDQPANVRPQVPLLPKPEIPVIKPFNPPSLDDGGAKFSPRPVPPGPDLLPVPNPPPLVPRPVPPPSGSEPVPAAPVPAPRPAPTILDEIPPIPFQLPVS